MKQKLLNLWQWLLRHAWSFSITLTLGGIVCDQREVIAGGLAALAITAMYTVGGYVWIAIFAFVGYSIRALYAWLVR